MRVVRALTRSPRGCRVIRLRERLQDVQERDGRAPRHQPRHRQGRVRLPGRLLGLGQDDASCACCCARSSPTRAASSRPAATSATCPSGACPYLRRNIGCVFQDFRLLPNKTVFENVAFALEVIGRPRSTVESSRCPRSSSSSASPTRATSLPNELSGGEQQRVAVARAFVNRPLILLADEPTGNLDPANSESIMALLDRINRTGTTVVMATHDKALVDRMRRRVIELDRGEMIRDQAARRLRRRRGRRGRLMRVYLRYARQGDRCRTSGATG